MEALIKDTKQLRKDLDAILQRVKQRYVAYQLLDRQRQESAYLADNSSVDATIHHTPIVTERLMEAIMWLGQDLKSLGTPDPYPESRNAENALVEPTSDNLTF